MTAPRFPATRWSLVARTANANPATARRALGELCEAYWRPLLAFAQRQGASEHDALDRVQAFCARLLERGGIAAADRDRGRFRSYLLGAFRHFAANAARSAARGAVPPWAWTALPEDDAAASAQDTPERAFERRWALELLARATARLRAEHATAARQRLLAQIEPMLLDDGPGPRAAAIAQTLETSAGAVRVALHRLRAQLRELIRDEVAQTVDDPADVDDELRTLQRALGR